MCITHHGFQNFQNNTQDVTTTEALQSLCSTAKLLMQLPPLIPSELLWMRCRKDTDVTRKKNKTWNIKWNHVYSPAKTLFAPGHVKEHVYICVCVWQLNLKQWSIYSSCSRSADTYKVLCWGEIQTSLSLLSQCTNSERRLAGWSERQR